MREYVDDRHPEPDRFDIVIEGETPGDDPGKAAEEVGPLAEAGMTWWLEANWATKPTQEHLERFRERVRRGPPVP